MSEVIKIHKPKPQTHLPAEEQAAREQRSEIAKSHDLPGTRQPIKRRAAAPRVRHTPAPTPRPS